MFHLSQVVKICKFKSNSIASPDTDLFVSSLHNYGNLMYFGLEELWFLTGLSTTRTFAPVLEAVDILESDMIRILPALHALTCNPSMNSALRVAKTIGYEYLHFFGNFKLIDLIITNAESFLLNHQIAFI